MVFLTDLKTQVDLKLSCKQNFSDRGEKNAMDVPAKVIIVSEGANFIVWLPVRFSAAKDVRNQKHSNSKVLKLQKLGN